jgi:oxygen-independent coproporphyrinogen-3 oxidase
LARPRTREAYAAWLAELQVGRSGDAQEPQGAMPFDERVLVGLRRREGVDLEALALQAGLQALDLHGLKARWQPFLQQGWLRQEGNRWRLTDPQGLALSNAVLRELVDWWEHRDGVSDRPPSP